MRTHRPSSAATVLRLTLSLLVTPPILLGINPWLDSLAAQHLTAQLSDPPTQPTLTTWLIDTRSWTPWLLLLLVWLAIWSAPLLRVWIRYYLTH